MVPGKMLDKASAKEGGGDEGERATVGTTAEATPTTSDCRYWPSHSYLLSSFVPRPGLNGYSWQPLRAQRSVITRFMERDPWKGQKW